MKKNTSRYFLLLAGLFLMVCAGFPQRKTRPQVVTGAEQMDVILPMLDGKRVALVVNQTSILEKTQAHILDTLISSGIDIKKVFAPEHGFRGTDEAGKTVADTRDRRTGVPVISIYGRNKKPTQAQLEDVDAVVFDIQDVGARFYTYISTMHYVMEACAEYGKEFIVLDRPNPNDFVDGPVRKKGYESFVSMDPIPVLHGLTVGELARMINGEGWLATKDSCRLQVVGMRNWKHGDPYFLPVRPSPNLPNDISVRLYPSLCFFEGTNISVGRGTYYPFQVIGYPDDDYGKFTFTPRPVDGMDSNPLHRDKLCYGEDLRELPFEGGLTLRFLLDFYERSGKKATFFSRPDFFDLLAGENNLRLEIKAGLSEQEIKILWEPELEAYRAIRRKYLIYADYEQ